MEIDVRLFGFGTREIRVMPGNMCPCNAGYVRWPEYRHWAWSCTFNLCLYNFILGFMNS